MMQKLIVPIAAVVLAVLAGLAIWFLMQDSAPRPIASGNDQEQDGTSKLDSPAPLSANDFDASRLLPDPLANQRPDQPFVAPEKTSRVIISGRVVTANGAGVPDAHVIILGGADGRIIPRANTATPGLRGSGYTDAAGFYRLLAWSPQPDISAQKATIAAETPDGGVGIAEAVQIPDAPRFDMADLVISGSAVIEGQVLSEDGQPAPGAEITIRSSGPVMVASLRGRAPSARMHQFAKTVFADANGNFRIANLPAARYGLDVFGAYFGATPARVEVDVSTQERAWQEVRLEADSMIRGVLTDQGGVPVPGAVVRLTRPPAEGSDGSTPITEIKRSNFRDATSIRDGGTTISRFNEIRVNSRTHCVTDSAGRFGFVHPQPSEHIMLSRVGTSEARLEGVSISPTDYRMQIDISTSIGGIVRDAETGRVIERFDARFIPGEGDSETSPFEVVGENGRFEFHPGGSYGFANPALGALRVRVCSPGYAPALVSVADVKEGDQRRDIDVSLKPLCRLTARLVRDGRALDFEPCALLFDDRLAYEASSDELGRVRIPDVTPAVYKVKVVLADGAELEGELSVPATHAAELDIKVGPAK